MRGNQGVPPKLCIDMQGFCARWYAKQCLQEPQLHSLQGLTVCCVLGIATCRLNEEALSEPPHDPVATVCPSRLLSSSCSKGKIVHSAQAANGLIVCNHDHPGLQYGSADGMLMFKCCSQQPQAFKCGSHKKIQYFKASN